jgi:hypothetical protein
MAMSNGGSRFCQEHLQQGIRFAIFPTVTVSVNMDSTNALPAVEGALVHSSGWMRVALVLGFCLAAGANAALADSIAVYGPATGLTGGNFTGDIVFDGQLSADWGVSVVLNGPGAAFDQPAAQWMPAVSGVSYWIEDSTKWGGTAGKVGPGTGGQNFDAEAAYAAVKGGTMYMAFVTGFDKNGQYGWNDSYRYKTGDLFIDINPESDKGWDFAIALRTRGIFTEGKAYKPTPPGGIWWTVPTDFGSSEPARLNGTAFDALESVVTGYIYVEGSGADDDRLASTKWNSVENGYVDADHNVFELALNLGAISSAFGVGQIDSLLFHWTQQCGNDVFELEASGPGPIPEPSSLILLGTGLAALAGRATARRRNRRR